jgi:hypothetical protein
MFPTRDKTDVSLNLAKQALPLAQKVNNNNGMAESWLAIGQCYPIIAPQVLEMRKLYNDKARSFSEKILCYHANKF